MQNFVTPSGGQNRVPAQSEPGNQNQQTGSGNFLKNNKWAIWLIVISVLVLAGLAYFVFVPHGNPQPKVGISIEAPAKLESGKEAVYKVHLANNDKSALKSITVDMIYPQGFTFTGSVPDSSTLNGTQFKLNSLSPGENAVIMVKGTLVGNVDESKSVQAIMHYTFSNFRSDFVVQAEGHTDIAASNIVLQFDGQGTSNNAQQLTYTLTYTNTSAQQLQRLSINISIPAAFKAQTFTPAPTAANEWDIPNLDPKASGQIQITGSFNGAAVGDKEIFTAEAHANAQSGQNVTLSNTAFTVGITAVPLQADLIQISNSNSAASDIVGPGDSLDYHIRYRNNSNIPLNGVVIKADIESQAIDFPTLRATNATVQNNIIVWDASRIPDFNSLQPNQSGELDFTFRIKDPATKSNAKNLTVILRTMITSAEYSQGFVSPDQTVKVQTTASVTGSVQHAGGPLPPKVGQTTNYIITLALRNASNDMDATVVTFNLPRVNSFDPSQVNSAEQGNVKYDPNTKRVTWNAGKLPAHTGDFNAIRKLQFTVPVTPYQSEVGNNVLLANNIHMAGTDTFVSQPITATYNNITTQDDPSASGTVVGGQ